jgi:Flp pilus assembly protein TadD
MNNLIDVLRDHIKGLLEDACDCGEPECVVNIAMLEYLREDLRAAAKVVGDSGMMGDVARIKVHRIARIFADDPDVARALEE